MSLELSGQDWSWYNSLETSPPSFPGDAGPDQEYDIVLWGYGWTYKVSNSMGAPNILTWQRFIEDEDRHGAKGLSYDGTAQAPSSGKITLKIRKK